MQFHNTSIILCSIMFLINGTFAQNAGKVAPGNRVRVKVSMFKGNDTIYRAHKKFVGNIVALSQDKFILKSKKKADSVFILIKHIQKIELSRGRKSRAVLGTVVGFFSGAVFGFTIMQVANKDTYDYSAETSFIGAGVLGVIGGVGGGLWGATHPADKWTEIEWPMNTQCLPGNR